MASAFFSGSETALMSVNRLRLRAAADQGNPRARLLLKLLEVPDKFITAILIGNNVVNILASSVATALAIQLWGSVGTGIAAGVMTILLLTFGEIIPKSLATRFADQVALQIVPVIHFLTRLLTPIAVLFNRLSSLIAKLVGGGAEPTSRVTEEEIQTLINLGQEEGVLDDHEHSLLRSIFDFTETTAEEVMVPRIDIVAIPLDADINELGEVFAEHRFSRLPVYDGTLDNVVGSVHMKDYIRNKDNPNIKLEDILRPVLFVPETLDIQTVFARMQRQRISTAIVLDEYGQTVGMITPSDITEEIMGRFMDEHDTDVEEFVTLKEGAIEVDGGYLIEDLNEECDFDIPVDTANTVGGYVFYKLGRLPRVNDRLPLSDKVEAVVTEMNGKRVAKVRLFPTVPIERKMTTPAE
jgi:CBS domain containing-hemolysin-like protein